MFLWVDSVQSIIKRCRRTKNQLNLRKVANHLRKAPKLGVSFTRGTCKPKKKFETNTTPEYLWTTETLITYVYSHGSMKGHMYLCEACILHLCRNGLNFFIKLYTQIKAPNKILDFFDYFFINIFFSVLNETKKGELYLGPNRFFHPPP